MPISSDGLYFVFTLAIFICMICQQLRVRKVRDRFTGYMVLFSLGLYEFLSAVAKEAVPVNVASVSLCALSLFILSPGFGILRACLMKVWKQNGTAVCRGNAATVALWVTAVVIHMGMDTLWKGSSSSILVYMAISVVIQRAVVYQRSLKLA